MKNPIIERELIGLLRTRKALAMQVAMAVTFALLVIVRWPTDARVDLSGAQSRQVFGLFGYGLMTTLILLAPVFPSTSIVQEKRQGTLALLLNSPMSAWSIYIGKLIGVGGFVLMLVLLSLPAAAACYAMGGIALLDDIAVLYGLLALLSIQYATLALLVSSRANSADAALRFSFGLVLLMSVVTLGPHQFLQGTEGQTADLAGMLRFVSPIPAVMEVLGHSDVGSQGLVNATGAPFYYSLFAVTSIVIFAGLTISRLNYSIFDRSRDAGVITDERSTGARWFRRIMYLVDPQRRKTGIGPFVNPIMVKEFRCRQFGRFHWLIRLVAFCALISLGLTYATTMGTMDWGVETIGGIIVMLQVALIVLLTPSLAAGLISSERESGGWDILKMTPLTTGVIIRGKLLSVVWTLLLILCATLPGYLVMIYIKPALSEQVFQVLICLVLTAVFSILLSAAVSSLFRQTAPATATSYALLLGLCLGTMLVWLGRDAPFGHSTVETVLKINPMAAALSVMGTPGFGQYRLVPTNWWIIGGASLCALVLLVARTWRLTRPA